MNKKKFLEKLEKGLANIEEEKRTKIIEEYKTKIKNETKIGRMEKDIINDFGQIEDIIEKYCPKKETEENNLENSLFEEEKLTILMKKLFEEIKKQPPKFTFKILGKCILLTIIISILKIPFNAITDISSLFLSTIKENSNTINTTIFIIVQTSYYILAIYLFIKYFKKIVKENIN